MQYFTEKLILQKACAEKWDENENAARIAMAKDCTTEVLAHWNRRHQMESFNDTILRNALVACERDNDHVVELLVARCWSKGNDESRKIVKQLNQKAAECNSIKTCQVLCNKFRAQFDETATALKNSIGTMNITLIEFIMEAMLGVNKSPTGSPRENENFGEETKQISPSMSPTAQPSYNCRDVFQAVIRADMLSVAKQIVQYRWHKPSEDDYELAKKLDNQVYTYLHQRQSACQTVSVMATAGDGDNDINLDDWGSDGDGDAMDEDDDDDWE